jgi:hypothetical protein
VLLLRLELAAGHCPVHLFLVLDLQLRDCVLAHPFTYRISLVRGQRDRLIRVVDARGFSVGGCGSGSVQVVLLLQG